MRFFSDIKTVLQCSERIKSLVLQDEFMQQCITTEATSLGVWPLSRQCGTALPGNAIKVVGKRQGQQGAESEEGHDLEAFLANCTVNCLVLWVVLRQLQHLWHQHKDMKGVE